MLQGWRSPLSTVPNNARESAGSQAPVPETIVTTLVGPMVFRAVGNTIVGLTAIGGAFTSVLLGKDNPLSQSEQLVTYLLLAVGVAVLADGLRSVHRARVRPMYGVLGSDLMVRDREEEWAPFLELATLEELSLTETERYSDHFFVSFWQGQLWTSIGPFEHGDRWAHVVAERAGELRGSVVPLSD